MKSAETAVKTSAARMRRGKIGTRCSVERIFFHLENSKDCAANVSLVATAWLGSITNPRIDVGIQNVHNEVDADEHHPAHEHSRLDNREIPEGNALIQQPSDAGPGKHRLYHHRDVHHEHQVDACQRKNGNHGILERMFEDYQPFGEAFDAGKLDVFTSQHFEHGRTSQSHMGGGEHPPQGK